MGRLTWLSKAVEERRFSAASARRKKGALAPVCEENGREGHDFSRAAKRKKESGFQPLRFAFEFCVAIAPRS